MSTFVTVVIPMFNEEHSIDRCLRSILSNSYPRERLEVILVDGGSADRTRRVAEGYAQRYPFVRLVDNPGRVQAAAMNIGLAQARGDVIVRMDAHTVYAPDYISQSVALLESTGAAVVGGPQRPVGSSLFSRAVAAAMTSAFGAGDARYRRVTRGDEWVDTVYLGAWRKQTLQAAGGFDERWQVNEDYELNYRVRRMGGRILLSTKIRSDYHVRGTLATLARQYFRYGYWRAKTLRTHPGSFKWRQLAAPGLVAGLAVSLGLILSGRPGWALLGWVPPIVYGGASVAAATRAAVGRGYWDLLPVVPLVFWTMHLSWGLGFLASIGGPSYHPHPCPRCQGDGGHEVA